MKDIEIVKSLLSSQLGAYDELIYGSKVGNMDIVKSAISKGVKRFNIKIAFLQACSNGHMDIVLFIISKTNIYFDWDLELYHACLSGNLEFIISKGAAYNHNGFIRACLCGYVDVVKLFISRFGIYDIDYIIELLMKGENKDIIRLLISNGAVSKENYTNVFEIDIGMFSSVANSDLVDYVVNFL